MAEITYADSVYRFTDPIRYFKPADVYVAEVDNIPLKQIHTNTLWLKDQIDRSLRIQKVNRSDLDELRPYVSETDNKVRVLPGRYTARINDAYNKTRFAEIAKVALQWEFGRVPAWSIATYTGSNSSLKASIDKTVETGSSSATFLNGLMDRVFTYPINDPLTVFPNFIGQAYRDINIQLFSPLDDYIGFRNPANDSITSDQVWMFIDDTRGFSTLAQAEAAFIKFWGGVARLAVVDVPTELEIEVPNFLDSDFDYINENGTRVSVTAGTHRIDMVFIYSKPIDASSTTIHRKSNGSNEVITAPKLGILKGAGLVADLSNFPYLPGNLINDTSRFDGLGVDSDGNIQIKGSVADQSNTNNGFALSAIYGSFPSEDLGNLAPLLAEELTLRDPALIGQTILPVAYIVVRKSASTSNGNVVLTNEDLIDIRPFFRTAELTYNERAGIAAARPQLSIANPVVTKAELYYESRRSRIFTEDLINTRLQQSSVNNVPRTIGLGYILGGLNYGVEGAMVDYYKQNLNPNATLAELRQLLSERHGYPNPERIPENPDWDLATWARASDDPGFYPNDYINTFVVNNDTIKYTSYENSNLTTKLLGFGLDNLNGRNFVCIHFVKKTIPLDKSAVTWISDYFVNVSLLNCMPLTSRSIARSADYAAGGAAVWVEKRPQKIVIYCAWVANDFLQNGDENRTLARNSAGLVLPHANRDVGSAFAGWAVLNDEIITDTTRGSNSVVGGATIYPSVAFEVIGIPRSYSSVYLSGNSSLRLS